MERHAAWASFNSSDPPRRTIDRKRADPICSASTTERWFSAGDKKARSPSNPNTTGDAAIPFLEEVSIRVLSAGEFSSNVDDEDEAPCDTSRFAKRDERVDEAKRRSSISFLPPPNLDARRDFACAFFNSLRRFSKAAA